jgi:hypothetical protein
MDSRLRGNDSGFCCGSRKRCDFGAALELDGRRIRLSYFQTYFFGQNHFIAARAFALTA